MLPFLKYVAPLGSQLFELKNSPLFSLKEYELSFITFKGKSSNTIPFSHFSFEPFYFFLTDLKAFCIYSGLDLLSIVCCK